MTDLISGQDWLRPVHHLPGSRFGSGVAERLTVVGALARHAQTIPDSPFLTETGDELRMVSYAGANRVVMEQSAALAALGVKRGERVGVLGHNSIDFALAVLSILEAGCVATPLSHVDPPTRMAGQTEFAGVQLVLCPPSLVAVADALKRPRGALPFDELRALGRRSPTAAFATPKPTDAALIFFTSGTTGAPKAVVQSHFAAAQNAWSLTDHHRIRAGTKLLCVLPMHHVNGLEFTVFSALLGGGHTVVAPRFDGLRFWKTVAEQRIEIASLVPNLLRLLASRPELKGTDPTPLRYVVSAAAPLSVGVARQVWDQLGVRIVQGYGLSEVTNFSCLAPPDRDDAEYRHWMIDGRRTSIGPSLPNQEVDIRVDDAPAPPEAEGEIVIRGHCTMSGYLHNPTATEAMFRGGWVHTGDRGYYLLDAQGRKHFHVCGRTREIAKRSGAMVSLLEIDELLAALPGVADAGAAFFANSWVDEEIAAFVVPRPDAAVTEQSILRHLSGLLPFAAIPKRIEFVSEIPRTPSGKIRRGEIAERFAPFREHLFREPKSSARDPDPPVAGESA